jgi:hypothetical protein
MRHAIQEEFEDTKGAIRIRISKKNRQYNGPKKKYKRTNNDLQNIKVFFLRSVVLPINLILESFFYSRVHLKLTIPTKCLSTVCIVWPICFTPTPNECRSWTTWRTDGRTDGRYEKVSTDILSSISSLTCAIRLSIFLSLSDKFLCSCKITCFWFWLISRYSEFCFFKVCHALICFTLFWLNCLQFWL